MYLVHYHYENSVSWANSKTYIWSTLQKCKQRVVDCLPITVSSLDEDDIYSVQDLVLDKEIWDSEHCEFENWYIDISVDWFMFVCDDEVYSAMYRKIELQMITEL